MRKFKKGTLVTVVEDNDRRIPVYLANGWKEVELDSKQAGETEQISETLKKASKKSGERIASTDKKVNEAIKAAAVATAEGAAVDDGLFKKEDE